MPARPATQDHQRKQRKEPAKASATELAGEVFTFEGKDGKTYELPPASSITSGMIRKNRHLEELEMAFTIIEELASPEALAALDELTLAQYNVVLEEWQSHIGVSPEK